MSRLKLIPIVTTEQQEKQWAHVTLLQSSRYSKRIHMLKQIYRSIRLYPIQ